MGMLSGWGSLNAAAYRQAGWQWCARVRLAYDILRVHRVIRHFRRGRAARFSITLLQCLIVERAAQLWSPPYSHCPIQRVSLCTYCTLLVEYCAHAQRS